MCTCWHVIINSSPTWITVPLFVKVGVTSFLSSYPHSVSGTLHPPCSWILLLSVCLFDELSGLIHLPDFLCLILLFDVTAGVYFCACYTDVDFVKEKKKVLLFAELNFSSIPQRKCLKYIFFVLLCLLYCQLCNIFKTVRCYEDKNTSRFMMGKKA